MEAPDKGSAEDQSDRAKFNVDALQCSFCGKPRTAVADMVCGPTTAVAICNECVALCADIMAEQGAAPPPGA